MPKLLAIQSNPDNAVKLRMDIEIKEVNKIITNKSLNDFHCISYPAIMLEELPSLLIDTKPEILHFSGHGTKEGLIFENSQGLTKPIKIAALKGILEETGESIICFCINACNSSTIAKKLSYLFPYLISFPGKLADKNSIIFSKCFYELLALGQNIKTAFEITRSILLNSVETRDLPILIENKNHTKYTSTIYKQPSIVAKFMVNEKTNKPTKSDLTNFDFSFYVKDLPKDASSIVYEFIDKTLEEIEDEEPFIKIENLGSGDNCENSFYGNIMLRAWIWLEGRNQGIGIESSLVDALNNFYNYKIPKNCIEAYKQILEN